MRKRNKFGVYKHGFKRFEKVRVKGQAQIYTIKSVTAKNAVAFYHNIVVDRNLTTVLNISDLERV